MSSSIATINAHCDAAIEAIQKLGDVKQILSNLKADSQNLKQDVTSLLIEKQSLVQEISEKKQQVRDLEADLAETQSYVVTHACATSDCSVTNLDGDNINYVQEDAPSEDTDSIPLHQSETDGDYDVSLRKMDLSLDCTSVSSSCSESSAVYKKRCRSNSKWYKSPKKWRRMMRSNRLRSIILLD